MLYFQANVTIDFKEDTVTYVVSGETFNIKERIKKAGGKWNGAAKHWVVSVENGAKLLEAFGIDANTPLPAHVAVSLKEEKKNAAGEEKGEKNAGSEDGGEDRVDANETTNTGKRKRKSAKTGVEDASSEPPQAKRRTTRSGKVFNDRNHDGTAAEKVAAEEGPACFEQQLQLGGCDKRTLDLLCTERGIAKSGAKGILVARIIEDGNQNPVLPDAEGKYEAYRKRVYQLVSSGRVRLGPGKGAADLPWNRDGNPR